MESPKLSKLNDPQRRWRSFLHQAYLLGMSLSGTFIVVFLWNIFRSHEIYLPHEDQSALVAIGIGIPTMLFSILAAMLITTSYKRYQKIAECILTNDRESFLVIRDERLPVVIHVLQIFLSLLIIINVLSLTYVSFWTGVLVVGSAAFSINLYWIAITELQNPLRSPWFKERILKGWLEADINELLSAFSNHNPQDE